MKTMSRILGGYKHDVVLIRNGFSRSFAWAYRISSGKK